MSNVVQFDPKNRLLKLTNARNILLILGILQIGFHGWVLVSLPRMLEREPDFPEFVVRQRMTELAEPGKVKDTPEFFRQYREKEPEKFKELETKALEGLKVEREKLKAEIIERTPVVSWSGIGSGGFTLLAALFLPWMPGGLSVIAAIVFLGTIGVEVFEFGAGGLLNGIMVKIPILVMYFYSTRMCLEAETGFKVK